MSSNSAGLGRLSRGSPDAASGITLIENSGAAPFEFRRGPGTLPLQPPVTLGEIMSNRIPRVDPGNGADGLNVFLAPALALGMWNPFLPVLLKGNAQAHEGFATIASEWQAFVGHRLKEDFALMQRLTHSATPDQVLAAYTDFFQKAAEDYGKEIATISKLMTGVTTKMVAAAQSATDEATASMYPARKAA